MKPASQTQPMLPDRLELIHRRKDRGSLFMSRDRATLGRCNAVEAKTVVVTSDTCDAKGIRHVEMQTTVTGNHRRGYEAAERQAKERFFLNYDPRMTDSRDNPSDAIRWALESGHLDPTWFEHPHPSIDCGDRLYMFDHHFGVNPQAAETAWGIKFEIVPLGWTELTA